MMMAVTLWFMKSMKQINTFHWKKGSTKNGAMAEIQKIVTSLAGGSVPRCPPSMEFAEIEAEKLPPSQWDACCSGKTSNKSWLKEKITSCTI